MIPVFIFLILGCKTIKPTPVTSETCLKYHTGSFFSISKKDKDSIFIERRDSIEIIRIPNKMDTTTCKIIWITPCEYKLTVLSSTRRSSWLYDLKCKIISETEKYHIEYSRVLSGKESWGFEDKLWFK